MAKTIQRKIYKINSSRFRLKKWNLKLDTSNTDDDEIVAIGDNQILDFIRELNGTTLEIEQSQLSSLKNELKKSSNKKEVYKKINDIIFVPEICFVVMDKKSDYHQLNKKMILNGVPFKRLYGTTGGVKSSTIIYIAESYHDNISSRIENGRNKNIEFSAGKLEAYKSLTFTSSTKVSNPRNIVIVDDYETEFIEKEVITLDDSSTKYPLMKIEKDYKIRLTDSDGYMLISPEYAEKISEELGLDYTPSCILFRNSFLKGIGTPYELVEFAEEVAHSYEISDIYGKKYDIREVDMIIPKSVFKLWNSYKSIDSYLDNCSKNGYSFRVAKTTPKKLDVERNLNYQFLQTLPLSDNDIVELCKPTISLINDITNEDPIKTILFTKGMGISNKNLSSGGSDFTKALMVDKRMIEDPFVKTRVHDMIKKKANDAKIGVLKVSGNFQTIVGDVYGFAEHAFKIPSERRRGGLLQAGEIYSQYWTKKQVNSVACFRAPMSSHNNIEVMNVASNDDMLKWYKYQNRCMIVNSWDTLCEKINGADKDGDAVFSTDSEIIIGNIKKLPAVICKQKPAPKNICGFDDYVTANINGFGDDIGGITNKVTSMICLQSNFDKESDEFKELEYRILCGQLYQQNAIDKIKSIQANPMPKEWYEFKWHITERNEDGSILSVDEFNSSIIADKKPYFFIYNYQSLKKQYNKFINDTNIKCMERFGLTYQELLCIDDKSEEMHNFISVFNKKMPVDMSNSVMNKICFHVESELENINLKRVNHNFDYTILKTNKEYSDKDFRFVKKVYEEYKKQSSLHSIKRKSSPFDKDLQESSRDNFKNKFIEDCSNLDQEDLCNIVLDLCYKSQNSKQFAWDVSGVQIIKNLLKNNNYTVEYPELDENGSIKFNGNSFSLKAIKVGDEFAESN